MKYILLIIGLATSQLLSQQNNHSIMTTSMTAQSKTFSVSVNRPADEVYAFMSNTQNLSAWAEGLCRSIVKDLGNNTWLINTPNGEATVRFVEKNKFRIMDHYVKQGHDPEVYIPIRILENQLGSEVVFTLFRLPGMTDDRFEQDQQAVQKDLNTLKRLLDTGSK